MGYVNRLVILLIITFTTGVFSQENLDQKLSSENLRLKKLKSDIKILRNNYSKIKEERKYSYEALESIKHKELVLNQLIKELYKEEKKLTGRISWHSKEIKSYSSNIDSLKKKYAAYIKWLYKRGDKSDWEYLIDSESLSEAYNTYKSLNYVSKSFDASIKKLHKLVGKLEESKKRLASSRLQKQEIIKNKQSEQKELEHNITEKETLLKRLTNNQSALEKELKEKERAQEKIKQLIATLIKREAEAERSAPASYVNKFDYKGLTEISSLKGKLAWPVSSGKIHRKFGKNRNAKLKTVTMNYGIDILTEKSSEIYCVAEGFVSAIEWIPGYGSIVIINHKGKYRTVYGNVSGLRISEGDKVSAGQNIGSAGGGIEGYMVHFELWKGRDTQNPELWLKRE